MGRSFLHYFMKSSFGIMVSRLFGLLRDLVVAAVFGANRFTDAFFIAFAIPNLFRALFAEGALSSAYVPILAEKNRVSREDAIKYTNQIIYTVGGVILILIILVSIFPKYIILIFMPGYKGDVELLLKASMMLKIVMPYLLFVTVVSIITGYLNLYGSYFVSYSSTAMLNIFMIIGAYVGYVYGGSIIYLAYGVFFGGLFQFLYVFIYSLKKCFYLRKFGEIDKDLKKTFLLIVPSVAGLGVSQINFVVDRVFASFLATGSISYLYYANRLFQFPFGVFSVALNSVSLTEMSKALADSDTIKAFKIIDKSIISLLFIVLPATAGLMMLSHEISSLIYKRGSFGDIDAIFTAQTLSMYSVGLIFYSLVGLFTRVYYSKKDTATPVKIAFFMMFLNAIFDYVLMIPFKHAGIALSSSIVAFINTILLYSKLSDYKFSFVEYRSVILKIVFSVVMMTMVVYILKYYKINVIINVVAGGLSYFLFVRLSGLKIREVLR